MVSSRGTGQTQLNIKLKEKKMVKETWSSCLMVGLLFIALGGCTEGDRATQTSISSPSASAFQPKGTIQGKVRDTVTLQPIVNALVSIGLAKTTTDEQGQYILENVPATTDALNGTINGKYDITVDLRGVTSPVNMASAFTGRYPDFRYQDVEVKYTSLHDSSPCPDPSDDNDSLDDCGANNTNHDTPVDGLVANADVNVGKLASNIKGVVAGCSESIGDFFTPVPGATVTLSAYYSMYGGGNSGTGSYGNVVATAVTNANGEFTINNIEAGQYFTIEAVNSTTTPTKKDSSTVATPSDGQTLFLLVQDNNALHLCTTDAHGPTITAVSPEPGSDQAAGPTDVTFTFSEPVKQNVAAGIDPSNADNNLFGSIDVEFLGNKGGNVPYTLTWNASSTILTVSFTTGTSGVYEVFLPLDGLVDENLIPAALGVCPSDGNNCLVSFTTNGGPVPATPVLTLVNAGGLNEANKNTTGIFDWPQVSGAKTYNMYCRTDQIYFDGSVQLGTFELVSSPEVSNEDIFFGTFLGAGGQHALQYACKVRGVNSDKVEGPDSNTKTAKDAIGPKMVKDSIVYTENSDTVPKVIGVQISFNEPLDETTAETIGNYLFSGITDPPAVTAAEQTTVFVTGNTVILTVNGTKTLDELKATDSTLTVTGVKDVSLNTIAADGDVYHLDKNVVD
ncbi:MAG: hypothetical protein HY037_00235 [Nitrospirae bacterium]|nr:hypothetical protein [Candidatus Troglogloeales bacterium]